MKRYILTFLLSITGFSIGLSQNPVDFERLEYVKNHWQKLPHGTEAMEALFRRADAALLYEVVPVTAKTILAVSGNPHDYVSMGPYWWPDSAKADGLPYIRRDGERNPELNKLDRVKLDGLSNTVNSLAYAYYFTSNEKYARKAVSDLEKWFLNPQTKMNPNLNYAQMIPGHNAGKGRAAGLIDTYCFVELVDCITLLNGSEAMTDEIYSGLQQWFSDFADWFLTSMAGVQELNATNNHSIAYDVQVAAYAGFSGRNAVVEEIVKRFPEMRLFRQIQPDGSQPRELERTMAMHYTVYNLDHMVDMTVLSRRIGQDVFFAESTDGRSISKALEFIAKYLGKPQEEFPYRQINDWEGKQQLLCWTLWRSTLFAPKAEYERLFKEYSKSSPENFNWLRFAR